MIQFEQSRTTLDKQKDDLKVTKKRIRKRLDQSVDNGPSQGESELSQWNWLNRGSR
jgi:hypothetical protein